MQEERKKKNEEKVNVKMTSAGDWEKNEREEDKARVETAKIGVENLETEM